MEIIIILILIIITLLLSVLTITVKGLVNDYSPFIGFALILSIALAFIILIVTVFLQENSNVIYL